MPVEPDAQMLAAYWQGTLDPDAFARVDVWFAALPEAEQERLIAAYDATLLMSEHGAQTFSTPQHKAAFQSASERSRYRVGDTLGTGGMGVVNTVHDHLLDRDAALKICRPRAQDESPDHYLTRKALFEREIAILARLDHPGITPIYDAGHDHGGRSAYTMKRLDGRPLGAYLTQEQPSTAQRITIIIRCAEALAFAHSKGIVHRDLKPDNVLIGAYGAVTLVDWGIAGTIGDTHEQAALGTPAWMAPEQADGAAPDPRMDVWALGGLIVHCFSGAPPQTADPNAMQHIPKRLGALVSACLNDNPQQRPATAQAVIDDLRHWLDYGVIASDTLAWHQRLWLAMRKHPRLSLSTLGLVLFVSVLVAVQWRHQQQVLDGIHRDLVHMVETVALHDEAAVHLALKHTRQWLDGHPNDPALQSAYERFDAASTLLTEQYENAKHDAAMEGMALRYRHGGRWSGEIQDRLKTLEEIGLPPLNRETQQLFIEATMQHHLRDAVLLNLCYAYVSARLEERFQHNQTEKGTLLHDTLVRLTTGDVAGSALLRLLTSARLGAHEPELVDHELATQLPLLTETPAYVDMLLSIVSPDDKLINEAQKRLEHTPNAYWPNVFLARMALYNQETRPLKQHALIAHGNAPSCFWPTLLLAYASLLDKNYGDGLQWIERARQANPNNSEAIILQAALFTGHGEHDKVQGIFSDPHIAAHIHYHLKHQHGHPMELSCIAIQDSGIPIPQSAPQLRPLVNTRKEHKHPPNN